MNATPLSPSDRDAAAIRAAERVLVQTIDPALPRVSSDAWRRGVVEAEEVGLSGERELHVQLAVGSLNKGVEGAAQNVGEPLRFVLKQ